MALRTAKVSAMRGGETKVILAACCDVEARSSTIQPNPALPVEELHAASVDMKYRSGLLGFGSTLITGFDQQIQAAKDPALIPTGGREGSFLTIPHPSCTEVKFWG
ncbi:hypothetical protein Bca52824_066541 [Brassica carinata]|uniref:Uncharacterized protein n=1 Tax=Brassica carinata TaxID=52824 RepID=A0A8X7UDG7_BRACI|nr:hypothetical protein Bca52824_066541 [Brassica carinata]